MNNETVVLLGLMAFLVLFYGPVVLYFKLGWFKGFYHDLLGWHAPDRAKGATCDGVNIHAYCKHCDKEIMMDSQGNWFVGEDYK